LGIYAVSDVETLKFSKNLNRVLHIYLVSKVLVAVFIMDYKTALENLRQYNREYSQDNELLESVVTVINYITEDNENQSKEDIIEWAEQVKSDLLPKFDVKYTHCDFPHL